MGDAEGGAQVAHGACAVQLCEGSSPRWGREPGCSGRLRGGRVVLPWPARRFAAGRRNAVGASAGGSRRSGAACSHPKRMPLHVLRGIRRGVRRAARRGSWPSPPARGRGLRRVRCRLECRRRRAAAGADCRLPPRAPSPHPALQGWGCGRAAACARRRLRAARARRCARRTRPPAARGRAVPRRSRRRRSSLLPAASTARCAACRIRRARGREDLVDHQAHRTLEFCEALAEQVDQLHQERRLNDRAERAVGHRERLQVLKPARARAARLCQAPDTGDEHSQELCRVAHELAADQHRVSRCLVVGEQPCHVVERRGAPAAALAQNEHRLRCLDGLNDRAGLLVAVDEPALV